MGHNTIRSAVTPIRDVSSLAQRWNSLFAASDNSFFLSWHWIGTWLAKVRSLSYKTFLVEAISGEKTVGLAIFCEKHAYRHKILATKQWHLHKTGDPLLDRIWIEYNDFLVLTEQSASIRRSMWTAIMEYAPDVEEFAIGLSTTTTIDCHRDALPHALSWTQIEDTALGVSIANGFEPYWSTRTRNLRSQLNRSDRLLAESGYRFEATRTTDAFIDTFHKIAPMHIRQWQDQSGFENGFFTEFFDELARSVVTPSLFSCRLVDNKGEIAAAVVGFIHGQTLYFYLSGQANFTNNKIKPGLSLHRHIIQWCSANNIAYYDFMAGDYRYKRSLATHNEAMQVTYFQRPKVKFILENHAKTLKQWLLARVNF